MDEYDGKEAIDYFEEEEDMSAWEAGFWKGFHTA